MSGNERTGSRMDCLPFARDFYRQSKKGSNTKGTKMCKKVSDLLCDSQRSAIASVGSAGSTIS